MRRLVLILGLAVSSLAGCSSSSSIPAPPGGSQSSSCHGAWAACAAAGDCCSGSCLAGVCAPSMAGGKCVSTNDCAASLTCKSGVCVAGATCRDLNDVCMFGADCCSTHCSSAGLCAADLAPVANAGADRVVPYHSTVVMNGTSSVDPDGDPISFAWTLAAPAGSAAVLSSSSSPTPTFYADVAGVYTVQLTVSDGTLSSSVTVHLTAQNVPPVASAGANRTVPKNTVVTLDASASADPDQDPLTFSWVLASAPAGSATTLANPTSVQATFTPDLVGTYTATVTVSDGVFSSLASVTVTAVDTPPVASAGTPQTANVGNPVTLDGSASADPDHDPLTYAWTMTARPPGSAAALSGPTTVNPTFTPDLVGTYAFSLVVSDGANSSAPATVGVTAYHRIAVLAHDVVDAEYSTTLNKIVMVSGTPSNALYLYDPETETEQTVSLNKAPLAVSVSTDGKLAIVGHDAMLSYVNLATATRTKELTVSVTVGDVVLGTGFAYAFPASGAQWTNIVTVNLSTGAQTSSSGSQIYGGTRAKLHPAGSALYGATNNLSPDNLENYQISSKGIANYGWPSPYWGDHPFCGDLWMSQDGAHVFTRCGNVFNATPATECIVSPCGVFASSGTPSDMVYAGALQGLSLLRHASHSSAARQLVAIPDVAWNAPNADVVLECFDDTYFTAVPGSAVTLPPWAGPGAGYVTHGRFVFWRSDGSNRYAVVQGDGGTPVASTFGVVAY